ncbi:RHS repeat domain-containing protein, partial [Luteimonas aquatica]|uniref:RHS repeat domain-containing protein n=1 Tax=Luteimonas aquatica TaxID=450364 RepID=UPI003CE5A10C
MTCTAPASCAGQVMSQTDYDAATALPLRSYAFGKLKQTLTYNADGTVATVKDGNNNLTTLSGWKRGIPQSIKHPITPESPTGATESAVVDDNGWIQSTTDENGFVTSYGYDAMGRLTLLDYPDGDSVNWTSTTQSFAPSTATRYGLPAGHWLQTVS